MRILFGCILAVVAIVSNAQSIEEIIVTASPISGDPSTVSGSFNLINSDEITRASTGSLGQLLADEVGLANSSFGPGVGTPLIRGQGGHRILILKDGSKVTDVSSTSADHAIASDIGTATQIEVLRGPATLRYGPGAVGGVVNMIERIPYSVIDQGLTGHIGGSLNSNGDSQSPGGQFAFGAGQWQLDARAMYRDSGDVEIPGLADHAADDPDETTDGYIENSSSDSFSRQLGILWSGQDSEWGASYGWHDNDYGVPGGAHGHHEEEPPVAEEAPEALVRVDLKSRDYQAWFRRRNLPGVLESFELKISGSNYEHTELEIEDGVATPGTYFSNESLETSAEITHFLFGWRGYSGAELISEDFLALGEEAFVPASETSQIGIYSVHRLEDESYSLELGARLDQVEKDADAAGSLTRNTLNLGVNLSVPLSESQRFGLILSRSDRAPSSEEVFSEGAHVATASYEIGDLNLDNESSLNFEVTYNYEGPIDLRASVFYNDVSDYIYRLDTELLFNHDLEEMDATGLASCTDESGFDDPEELEEAIECFLYTQQDARFWGVELESVYALSDRSELRFWTDFIRATLEDDTDVPRMPPQRVGVDWSYSNGPWLGAVELLWAASQDRPGKNQESTEGYFKLDTMLAWRNANWHLYLKAENLTDQEIRNSTSFLREIAPEPGRSIVGGVQFTF